MTPCWCPGSSEPNERAKENGQGPTCESTVQFRRRSRTGQNEPERCGRSAYRRSASCTLRRRHIEFALAAAVPGSVGQFPDPRRPRRRGQDIEEDLEAERRRRAPSRTSRRCMKKPLIGSAILASQMIRDRRVGKALIFARVASHLPICRRPYAGCRPPDQPARLSVPPASAAAGSRKCCNVGIHDGDIGCGCRQCAFDAGRRESPPPNPLQAAHSPVVPANLVSRIRSAVPSGESSSTKITSQLTASRTACSRSTSGLILSRSLRVGMTTVNSGPAVTGLS
jgi:hypothetical protein